MKRISQEMLLGYYQPVNLILHHEQEKKLALKEWYPTFSTIARYTPLSYIYRYPSEQPVSSSNLELFVDTPKLLAGMVSIKVRSPSFFLTSQAMAKREKRGYRKKNEGEAMHRKKTMEGASKIFFKKILIIIYMKS